MSKAKNIVIVVLALAIAFGYPIMYYMGIYNANSEWHPKLTGAYDSISTLQQLADTTAQQFAEQGIELANALAHITEQDALIEKYEAREAVNVVVIGVRDIDVQLFKEVQVKISAEKEYPWSVFSDKIQLNPNVFGNFVEISEELDVTYYYGAVGNQIKIENVDNKQVNISYSASAFMNPYRIGNRDVDLNLGAKLMTTTENDEIYQLVNSVGLSQLSDIEDAFIAKLKSEYKSSDVPIYVNGTLLEDWGKEDKIFSQQKIDSAYSIQVVN